MFFCPVAGWFVSPEKCERIAKVMDNRLDGRQLPLGVTKTVWTQKRCLRCGRRREKAAPGKE